MKMKKTNGNSQPARVEQRKSKRFLVAVPAEVKWHGPGGTSVKENAQAEEVSAEGGLLRMGALPEVGETIELTNLISSDTAQARVLAIRRSGEDGTPRVAVELVVPSESFWGVNFQLKKNTIEILKLAQALQSASLDSPLLRDFRDAVDHIRKIAWAVEEWEERHLQRQNHETTLSLLTAERIRRATYLCNELAAELEASEVSFGTKGIAEFYRAVERVSQSLERSHTYPEAR